MILSEVSSESTGIIVWNIDVMILCFSGGRPIPSAPPLDEDLPPYPTEDTGASAGSHYQYPQPPGSMPASASSGERLYPDLSDVTGPGPSVRSPSVTAEEIRQRRLQRFDKGTKR